MEKYNIGLHFGVSLRESMKMKCSLLEELSNFNKKQKLSTIYDKIESQLRALESLQVTTNKCAAMLYPLIESSLPEDIIRVWQRSPNFISEDNMENRLKQLMNFMKKEVENEERISLATSGFDLYKNFRRNEICSAELVNTRENTRKVKCIFCKQEHQNYQCNEAKKLTLEERKKILSDKGCCHLCLRFGHIARKCRVPLNCSICGGRHSTLVCSTGVLKKTTENLSNNTFNEVFLQTILVKLNGPNENRYVRALIDTGSQRSYINKYIAESMGLAKIGEEEIVHLLFGGVQSESFIHSRYKINLSSLDQSYECSLEVLDQPMICDNIASLGMGPWMNELKNLNIELSDSRHAPIEILFGADVAGKLLCGPRYVLECGLVALKTVLGWTVMGKVNCSRDNKVCSFLMFSMLNRSLNLPSLWNLDILGITDPVEIKSLKDNEIRIKKYFEETLTRNSEGRYVVSMPWIEEHPPLPNNIRMVMNRLDSLMKRLAKDGYFDEYDKVFKEWLSEGVIELLPNEELKNDDSYYLPHHHVVKLNSATTKLRPVFDASANLKDFPSLNQCLEKGINLIAVIPSILLRFRWSKFGVTADIKRAFLQIGLHEKERNFLRFLWYNENKELIVYRHARVVFGITCSPFLLAAVINYHLENTDGPWSKEIVDKLKKSFYVDNCIFSIDTKTDLKNFIEESTGVMAECKFDLRGWEYTQIDDESDGEGIIGSSVNVEMNNNKVSSVLGLLWDRSSDFLSLSFESLRHNSLTFITKKTILSITNKVYDPIGFSSPVMLCPKLMLQEIWSSGIGWNTEVPEGIKIRFLKWVDEINALLGLKIPRWLMCDVIEDEEKLSFHVFCDASANAYAAVIFLRSESKNKIGVQLVQAKSRVAPLKQLSIPRLELLAATIGVRLMFSMTDSLSSQRICTYYWSDSTTVLHWIKRKMKWKPFVYNRILEIKKFSSENSWFFVPGSKNPADLASRGCSADYCLKSRWWEGPSWLFQSMAQWPEQDYDVDENLISQEMSKVSSVLVVGKGCDISWVYKYFSRYEKIIKLIGWIRRFVFNSRHEEKITLNFLSVEELLDSEKFLIKCIQQESFIENGKEISSLCPFLDEDGITRIRTRIIERDENPEFLYPILLPAKHVVVKRLIFDSHVKACHVGVQGLLCMLREKFWIIGGRKTIKSVIFKCMVCRRHAAKRCETAPVVLPKNRIRDAAVFEIIGVDLFGPLHLRKGQKVWVVIFTCAVYRAVHLELVSDLSTNSFLLSFRRFISRRGRPKTVYSDNGSNFHGFQNLCDSIDLNEVMAKHALEKIVWKFIPPTACWWGGWWERLIRLIKNLLKRVLGRTSLDIEELSTILCDCEAVVNDRPLTYISEDKEDLKTLSPSMFLREIKELRVPDLDVAESENVRRRYRYRIRIMEDLRKRFRREYLSGMIMKSKRNKNFELKIGDVVFVETDKKRVDWPLARIEEIMTGKDGEMRLIRLKTANGLILRPVQRVYPLEMDLHEADMLLSSSSKERFQKRKSERRIKPPDRLNL